MANEGFDETVTEENGPGLQKFAYNVLKKCFQDFSLVTEDERLQKRLAMWLRDEEPQHMADPNAPLSDAKFTLGESIRIPPMDNLMEIIGMAKLTLNKKSTLCLPSFLENAQWSVTDGSELSGSYYIEEETLCFSVEGEADVPVGFSVYRLAADGTYEKIAENLPCENHEGVYTAKWQYRHNREQGRTSNVKLYFRAHKNNATQTESTVQTFVDGIVAIKTERNVPRGQGKFFDFSGTVTNSSGSQAYGGAQQWYERADLLANIDGWNERKGVRMSDSGCGPIAATNIQYYYAQQFDAKFARVNIPDGFKDTSVKPNQAEYMELAFDIYNSYTMQTIPEVGLGIWFIDPVCDGLVKFARERGISLIKHTLTNKLLAHNDFKKAADFITEGLKNNYPVILLITLNTYIASFPSDSIMAEKHFVAITAIERVASDEEDYELTISHWGHRKTIRSLKQMWAGTPPFFNGIQIASMLTPFGPLANSFASVSLGYCSFA